MLLLKVGFLFLEVVFVIEVDDVFLKIALILFFLRSFGGSEK